ncbi:transporter substrate-binding domain-containing protein [Streptomyces sp. PSKA30]|uniref:transporter substrate-binding domain-containing protein n=1 Tax=Streptomyces sp. PSKA30 TaxID=2874597 RepID=UPI001CD0F19E|nr:transporter substrate-binding domain-containing protein [Streptomyces sp. PSKA30]
MVGSDLTYPSMEFKGADGSAVGFDPDLAAALGRKLGVKFPLRTYSTGLIIHWPRPTGIPGGCRACSANARCGRGPMWPGRWTSDATSEACRTP